MAPPATRTRRLDAVHAWVPGTLLALVLAGAYLVVAPPSADLAAADYRSALLSRAGVSLWDNGWYAGHHLAGYSLLGPALGALLSPPLVAALAVVGATALFAALAGGLFGARGARGAGLAFAVAMSGEALAGRVPFALGVAVGMAALLALARGQLPAALAAALLCSLASPVAGLFLALVAAALVLSLRDDRALACRAALVIGAAALPVLVLALLFPEGGYEPFAFSDLWPALLAALAVAVLVGRWAAPRQRAWTVGAGLYALTCLGAFVVHTPLGSNVSRLAALALAPLLAGTLGSMDSLGPRVLGRRWAGGAAAAAAVAAGLAWALASPITDAALVHGDPSVSAAYYRPLLAELQRRRRGTPLRIEVPLTGAHWEARWMAGPVSLARGWERQLDTRYARLFYRPGLDAGAYHRWLLENAVAYVALPDVRLDEPAQAEARLIERGLPYLAAVWHSARWRLYAVRDARPLASAPAALHTLDSNSFTLEAPRAGTYTVAVRFTPYWRLSTGHGCVAQAPGGWTRVLVRRAGRVRVGIGFSLARMLGHGPRCRA